MNTRAAHTSSGRGRTKHRDRTARPKSVFVRRQLRAERRIRPIDIHDHARLPRRPRQLRVIHDRRDRQPER